MSCCAAVNCSKRDVKINRLKGFTFHKFPHSKPALLEKWVINMKRIEQNGHLWHPGKSTKLCSAHFTPDCFDRTGQTVRLRCDAVPTVFSFPHLQKTVTTRKTKTSKRVVIPSRPSDSSSSSTSPNSPDASKNGTTQSMSSESSASLNSTSAGKTPHADHSYFTLHSPGKLKRTLDDSTDKRSDLSRRLKLEKAKKRRLQDKIDRLTTIINSLQTKRLSKDKSAEKLENSW